MKLSEISKSMIAAISVLLVLFLTLELVQRVRWYFKSDRSAYWLLYGFVERTKDYDRQIAMMSAKITTKKIDKGIREIKIWSKIFPSGIKKHNPDFPDINSHGFRSYEFNPKKERGAYRMIAVGGSTTGGYESDINHTYPALLQKKLNEGNGKFEVINAGMGEKEMPYINDLLEKELINYEPDMALLYLTFNHLHMRRGCVSAPDDFYYKAYKFQEKISEKSLLFLTLREKIAIMLHHQCGDLYVPIKNSKSLARAFLNNPEIFESYKTDLEKFISICKKHNITPVLMTEACICKDNAPYLLLNKEMKPVYNRMYAVMEDVAKKNSAIFIDTARAMEKIPNNEALYTDGLHFKPEGNEVLAGIIYAHLKEKLKQ